MDAYIEAARFALSNLQAQLAGMDHPAEIDDCPICRAEVDVNEASNCLDEAIRALTEPSVP